MAPPRKSRRTDVSNLARSFTARRHELGLTQAELALLAGVGRSTVQAIEGGKDAPQLDGVNAVAAGNTLFSEESLRKIVATTRPPRPTVTLDVLTDKERTVLSAMASGATNADIARQLYMAETTVKSHLTAVNHKLHVTNRVEAALMAFRAGLVVQGPRARLRLLTHALAGFVLAIFTHRSLSLLQTT